MTDPVVLAGPASARALSVWLHSEDGRRARELPGMGGTALTNIVDAFSAGHHVELVTLAPELRDEVVVLEGSRLRILIAPFRPVIRERCLDAFRQERRHVRALVARTSGRVVNAHWTYEFALGATDVPHRVTVVTAHDAPFTILRYQRPRRYLALRAAMAAALSMRAPALTAVSPYLAASWRRQMLYRGHISVVPNVVPFVTGERSDRNTLMAPLILDVADAGKRKNVLRLVRAMPEILDVYPHARLRLVGRGLTSESSLAVAAKRLGVGGSVEFLGRVEVADLDAIYREADIFAQPSLEDSFSMSVAEAMSHKLPIVAGSRSGAIPWLLDQGRAGLLVDVRDASAIARGVTTLISTPQLRRELASVAQDRARACFSPEAVSAAYLDAYDRAGAAA